MFELNWTYVTTMAIFIHGYEMEMAKNGVCHSTFGISKKLPMMVPPSIIFVSVEHATSLNFVELAHTLNHLGEFHCIVVNESHLLLLDFRPVMKQLLPLLVMGCEFITLMTYLSPSQEMDLMILMSTWFVIIRLAKMRVSCHIPLESSQWGL
jgi:hypothetical protein